MKIQKLSPITIVIIILLALFALEYLGVTDFTQAFSIVNSNQPQGFSLGGGGP